MRTPREQRRTRARLALAACALWILGVEAMPGLHQLLHERLAPHRHGAAPVEIVERAVFQRDAADGERGLASRDPERHAAGSLAHRELALQPAPPPLLHPLPVDRQVIYLEAAICIPSARLALVEPTARGPPGRTSRLPRCVMAGPRAALSGARLG